MTDEDIAKLVLRFSQVFTTKEDLEILRKEMATKEDLGAIREEMATKEDIKTIQEEMQKVADSQKQLSKDLGEFFDDVLLPQIAEKADKSDLDRLEEKIDKVIDSNTTQNVRLSDIESIPSIAHELKSRKSK